MTSIRITRNERAADTILCRWKAARFPLPILADEVSVGNRLLALAHRKPRKAAGESKEAWKLREHRASVHGIPVPTSIGSFG